MPAARNAEPQFTVRFYRPGDEDGILRVLQASFPRWPEVETNIAPIDHLRWKIAGARGPIASHVVAEAPDGQIVGSRLSITTPYRYRDTTVIARRDMDYAVLPEWRGRGVSAEISSFVVPRIPSDMVITSSGHPTVQHQDRGLGHQPFGNRFVSFTCDLSAQPEREPSGAVTVRDVARFDQRIESFLTLASAGFEFIAVPSEQQLNWRFCDARGGNGRVLQAEERGDIVGFAALRVSHSKAYIAALLVLPGRIDALRDLVRCSFAYARGASLAEVVCALPKHHPYRQALTEEGFTRKRHAIPLTCRPVEDRVDVSPLLKRNASVHLMLGDFDFI